MVYNSDTITTCISKADCSGLHRCCELEFPRKSGVNIHYHVGRRGGGVGCILSRSCSMVWLSFPYPCMIIKSKEGYSNDIFICQKKVLDFVVGCDYFALHDWNFYSLFFHYIICP